MHRIKITVLKKTYFKEIADKYRSAEKEVCQQFQEGQEFITEENSPYGPPNNFCPFAWNDIYKFFFVLKQEGLFSADMKDDHSVIACCTDGVRPVIFKIERIR